MPPAERMSDGIRIPLKAEQAKALGDVAKRFGVTKTEFARSVLVSVIEKETTEPEEAGPIEAPIPEWKTRLGLA